MKAINIKVKSGDPPEWLDIRSLTEVDHWELNQGRSIILIPAPPEGYIIEISGGRFRYTKP